MKRGGSEARVSSLGLSAFKWMDNRAVFFASNYHGTEVDKVKRKNQKGDKLNVSCPVVVKDYNQNMGGVDCADQLRQYYNVNRRSRK